MPYSNSPARLVIQQTMIAAISAALLLLVANRMFALSAEHAIQAAASRAAREASLAGATPGRVRQVARETLSLCAFDQGNIAVKIEPAHPQDARSGALICVTVGIDAAAAHPGWLRWARAARAGQRFEASHVARKE